MADEPIYEARPGQEFQLALPPINAPGLKDKLALLISALRDGYEHSYVTIAPSPDFSPRIRIDGDALVISFDPEFRILIQAFGFIRYQGSLPSVRITPDRISVQLNGLPDPVLEIVG